MQIDEIKYYAAASGRSIAFRQQAGRLPGVIFFCGFKSNMDGTKAMALKEWCTNNDIAYTRFDYSGHGKSSGEFEEGNISHWLEDCLCVIDSITEGPQIIVGSSMGAWLMLRAACERPTRVAGMLGIASAADFTEILFNHRLTAPEQKQLLDTGKVVRPSVYDKEPYIYTLDLIEDGRRNLVLDKVINLSAPLRLIHSIDDPDVPWTVSFRIQQQYHGNDTRLLLLDDAGHRLSRPSDLSLILATLGQLIDNHKR